MTPEDRKYRLNAALEHLDEYCTYREGSYLASAMKHIVAVLLDDAPAPASGDAAPDAIEPGKHIVQKARTGEWFTDCENCVRVQELDKENATLRERLAESTTDLVVTADNIHREERLGRTQWEGVYEHLRKQIEANRAALSAGGQP